LPTGKSLLPIASAVARLFSPQSKSLGIDLGAESPGVLRKAIYAATNGYSFAQASLHLAHLAELNVSVKQVERLAQRIGQERIDERDAEVAAWKDLPLAKQFEAPPAVVSPDLAVIMVDGGRMQFRDGFAHATPAPDSPSQATNADADWVEEPPSKSSHWREDKVGLVMTMESEVSAVDPCPAIPPGFIDVLRIPKLVRELGKSVSPGVDAAGEPADPEAEAEALREETEYEPPEVLERQVVATSEPWQVFATIVANRAYREGAQGAKRKAFVGDGSANNWKLRRRFFGSFEAILDFIHALSYVFAAALAGKPFAEGWKSYQEWIGWVWEGRVGKVIEELQRRQEELGKPEKGESETSPRSVVASSLGYLRNQQGKMKYHEYRKQGLPITSSLMESGVKQMNQRVKGTEKFWSQGGGEAMLQLRADTLCDGEVMEGFWERRQAAATGQRRYRRAG